MSGSECSSSGRQFPQNVTDADIEDFFFVESPFDPLSMDYDNAEDVDKDELERRLDGADRKLDGGAGFADDSEDDLSRLLANMNDQ